MNGNSSVHRLQQTGENPNICKCGHDITVHSMTLTQNKCSLCLGTGVSANNHYFESPYSINNIGYTNPDSFFGWTDIQGYVNAGGLGFRKTTTLAAAVLQGDTTCTVGDATGVKPGMTFYVNYSTGTIYDATTYTIANVAGNVLTLLAPNGFVFAIPAAQLPNVTIIFDGTFGSGMGPGRPRNGQRQG